MFCAPRLILHQKVSDENSVPLRQNACNFWPLKKRCFGWKYAPVYVKCVLFENVSSRARKTICFQTLHDHHRLQQDTYGIVGD